MKGPVAAALLLFGSVIMAPIFAATPEEANELYQSQDWRAAEKAYRELAEQAPDNTLLKYRLAVTLRNQGKLQAAGMWLDQAKGGMVPDAFVELERARLLLAEHDRGGAMRALEAAAAAGFQNPAAVEADPALEKLRDHPGFAGVLEQMDRNRAPCEHMPEFSQFDFWLGDWRVQGPDGTFQGTNTIQKTQGGCLVLENWTGAGGTTGASMNFYDPNAREWVQVWVSATVQLEIRGGLVDGSMRLTGHIYYLQTGDYRPFRGTWTPLGDCVVRQHFEESADDGATWTTWFDGYYHPADEGGDQG